MSYKGKYQPRFPSKYKGNPTKIIFRSLWERKFMRYCDFSNNILEWASEEISIPYRSPIDRRIHKYFPDFYIKVQESNGKIKKYLIEIKPKRQTKPPVKKSSKKAYIYEAHEYAKNQAKWKMAKEFCKDRLWEFKVMTEKELGIVK